MIIGISTDTLADQEGFTKKESLNFPLFADAEKKAARTYGVLSAAGYAQRKTFVIDKKGVVRKIYTVRNIRSHMDEVLAYLKDNLG